MVFNKVTVFLVVLGLAAVSSYPTADKKAEVVKSEAAVEVPTTAGSLSDDVQDAVTTVASDVLADDVAVTTELSVAVRNEEVAKEPEVIAVAVPEAVETKVITGENVIIPVEKTAPVVVAEIVGEKVVPVVEVVEIVPVEQTGPVSDVKSATVPKVETVVVPVPTL